ncbi:MAG: hypothetical protein P4K80_05925 [Acidobacteriaceae bacterium]|nr:hypothetical protein [Acidobacteriaceae bacterium]
MLTGQVAFAQTSVLPATPVTNAQQPVVGVSTIPQPATTPAQPAAKRAQVDYSAGQLSITADNSSLNQILREVVRKTGVKITGGVSDERVYGKYGPGSPSKVVAKLLEGTGSNIFLRETSSHTLSELILTPRQGGPTPPSPNAPGIADDDDQPAQPPSTPQSSGPQPPPPNGTPHQPMLPAYNSANTPSSTNTSTDPSQSSQSPGNLPPPPNGVISPPQIEQRLQQLQSRQPDSQ